MTCNKSYKRVKKRKNKTRKSKKRKNKTRNLKRGGFAISVIDTSKIHPASIILRKI